MEFHGFTKVSSRQTNLSLWSPALLVNGMSSVCFEVDQSQEKRNINVVYFVCYSPLAAAKKYKHFRLPRLNFRGTIVEQFATVLLLPLLLINGWNHFI